MLHACKDSVALCTPSADHLLHHKPPRQTTDMPKITSTSRMVNKENEAPTMANYARRRRRMSDEDVDKDAVLGLGTERTARRVAAKERNGSSSSSKSHDRNGDGGDHAEAPRKLSRKDGYAVTRQEEGKAVLSSQRHKGEEVSDGRGCMFVCAGSMHD